MASFFPTSIRRLRRWVSAASHCAATSLSKAIGVFPTMLRSSHALQAAFPPASYRQRISFWSTRKVRRVLEPVVDPQVLVTAPPPWTIGEITCSKALVTLRGQPSLISHLHNDDVEPGQSDEE